MEFLLSLLEEEEEMVDRLVVIQPLYPILEALFH